MEMKMWIGIILALVFAFMFYKGQSVKNTKIGNINKGFYLFFMFILIVGSLYLGGVGSFLSPTLNSPLSVGVVTPQIEDSVNTGNTNLIDSNAVSVCEPGKGVEDTTVTLSAIDAYNDSATAGSHRYRINGNAAKTVSDGGTFTASPGDKLEILFANGATTGAYYSDVVNVVVPCAGTKEYTANLYHNGTNTVQVFNEENQLIGLDGTTYNNETLAAGDVVTLKAEVKGSFQAGMPFGGLLIVEYNSTEIDNVIADFGNADVVPVSSQFYPASATDHAVKAYRIPALLGNAIVTGSIVIDADDTVNPSASDNIDLKLVPFNYFIDNNKGGAIGGPAAEDEANVATYAASTKSVLYTD